MSDADKLRLIKKGGGDMRIVFVMLAALSLVGCASNSNYSSLDDPADKTHSNLVLGDVDAVTAAIRQSIHEEYPASQVNESFGVFSWRDQSDVNYRLEMFVGTGLDVNKQVVKGYFYTVNFMGRFVAPLNETIQSKFASSGLKTVKVSSVIRITMRQEALTVAENAQACFSRMGEDPRFAIIKTKISFGTATDQSFAMLTDNSKPSPEERNAIRVWGQVREGCLALQRTANDALGTEPQIRVLMDSLVTNQQSLIAQLYLGNLTYGEFAAKRQSLANNFRESASNLVAQLKNQEREAQDRKDLVQAIHSIPAPVINASSGPKSCSFIGHTMYCN